MNKTIEKTAEAVHVGRSTINKLLRANLIRGRQTNGRKSHWVVTSSIADVKKAVKEHAPKAITFAKKRNNGDRTFKTARRKPVALITAAAQPKPLPNPLDVLKAPTAGQLDEVIKLLRELVALWR